MDTIVKNPLKVPFIISKELDILEKEIQEKKQEEEKDKSLERSHSLLKYACLRGFNKELANLKSGDKILWTIKNEHLKAEEEGVFMVKTISQIKFKNKNHPKDFNEKDWVEKQFRFLVALENDFECNIRTYGSLPDTEFLNVHFLPILPSAAAVESKSTSLISSSSTQLRNWEEDAKVTIQILEECFPNKTIMLLNENFNLRQRKTKRKLESLEE